MTDTEKKPYPNVNPFRVAITAGGREFTHTFNGQVSPGEYDYLLECAGIRQRDGREITVSDERDDALDRIYEAHGSAEGYAGDAPFGHRIKAAELWASFVGSKVENPDAAAIGEAATVIVTCGAHTMRLKMRTAIRPDEDREIRRASNSQTTVQGRTSTKGLGHAWVKLGKALVIEADGYEDNGLHSIPAIHLAEAAARVWHAANNMEAVEKN